MFNSRFYIFILLALVVSSCHKPKTSTIEVSISDSIYHSWKGKTAKLFVDGIARDSLTIDSTKFQFNNILIKDSALNYSYIEINGFDRLPSFVLSKDTTFIKEGYPKNSILGSKLNQQIAKYIGRFYEINDSVENIKLRDTLVCDTSSSKHLLDSVNNAKINILYNSYLSYSKDIIKKHKNDALGLIALLNIISDKKISLSDKIDYVKSMSNLIQNNREVMDIMNMLEIEDRFQYSNVLDFSGVNIDGKQVNLSDYIGKKKCLLVSFMDSYLNNYYRTINELEKLKKHLNKDSISVVIAIMYSSIDEVKPMIKKLNIKYPCIINNELNPKVIKSIYTLPTTILFNSKGNILRHYTQSDSITIDIDSLCAINKNKR